MYSDLEYGVFYKIPPESSSDEEICYITLASYTRLNVRSRKPHT